MRKPSWMLVIMMASATVLASTGAAFAWATATGGTITNYTLAGTNWMAHIFTNADTFRVSGGTLNCEVLVVAGGGAGRGNGGGDGGDGGSAGQLAHGASYPVAGPVGVTIGGGGIGVVNAAGGNGANSVFGTMTATGGIGGQIASDIVARNGGAGAGGAGGIGGSDQAGAGGAGLAYSLSGSSVYYAGGGGGGWTRGGLGGSGGGGRGADYIPFTPPYTNPATAGTANTGGGGGGVSGDGATAGKNGGSGIVIVRYLSVYGPNNNLPFNDDFESYTNLYPLDTGVHGWYGSSNAVVVVSDTNIAPAGSTNMAMIPMDCTLSSRFNGIPRTNIWIQMDMRPSLYGGINYPVKNTNQVWLFYVNSNGNFVVHNGPVTNAGNSKSWVTNSAAIATNGTAWTRINIYENFTQTNWDLYADGVLVTNNIGFLNPAITNFTGYDVYNGARTSYLDNVSVTGMAILSPSALSRNVFKGVDPSALTQTFNVRNPWSNSNILFVITTNQDWVAAAPLNGLIPAGGVQPVTLTYASAATSWPAGTVSNALVEVADTNGSGSKWEVAVAMSVMDLQVTTNNIMTNVMAGATPGSNNFAIGNAGAGSFYYTATIPSNCNWLSLSATSGTANAFSSNTLTLSYSNTAGWMSGESNTTITIVSGDGGGATQAVNVALRVSMTLRASASQLTNAVMQGEWTSNSFEVSTTNNGIANYTVSSGQDWMRFSPPGGFLTGKVSGATNMIVVAYTNTSVLMVGANYGTITLSAPGCANVTIGVTLNVRAVPMLNVSPMLVTSTVMEGQNPAANVLLVRNGSADYALNYQVATNQGGASPGWLSVVVTNNLLEPLATDSLAINYAVSSCRLAGDVPSNYSGVITVGAAKTNGTPANGSPVTIPVALQVNPKPRLALSLANLSQTALQGQDAASQGFDVWNSNGYYTLNYTISKGGTPWLVLPTTSGSSTGQVARIVVQYSTANLPTGTHNALITVVGQAWDGAHFDSALSATQTIAVALTVMPFATLWTDAQPAYAYAASKGLTPPDTVFSVKNGGDPRGAMYFTVSPSASWLRVTPASGTSTGNMVAVRVQADPAGMRPGVVNRGTVRIDAIDAGSGKPAYGSPSAFAISVVISNIHGFDFQGGRSGASDLVLYREVSGAWETTNLLSHYSTNLFFGGTGYQAVPGDYFGDGITDLSVYLPLSGNWYAWQLGAASVHIMERQQWAAEEYAGVPGDYDGDGKTDPGVYLEKSGLWMLLMSGSGYQQGTGMLGGEGYTALLAGDYDGDGKDDPGVYHRTSGLWVIFFSTSQSFVSGAFGGAGFVPVPTDYDGDGITDVAVYGTDSGLWYILPSTTLTSRGYSLWTLQFGGREGATTLVPAPGNYGGAGRADLGLYDTATLRWYIITLDGTRLAWGYPMGRPGCLPVLP